MIKKPKATKTPMLGHLSKPSSAVTTLRDHGSRITGQGRST